MSFANRWGNILPASYKNVETREVSTEKTIEEFDAEFEAFCAEQRQLKAERQAKEVQDIAKEVEVQPTDEVAEAAYQAFVEEDEKPKSKRKRKTEEVVEETSDETPVAED